MQQLKNPFSSQNALLFSKLHNNTKSQSKFKKKTLEFHGMVGNVRLLKNCLFQRWKAIRLGVLLGVTGFEKESACQNTIVSRHSDFFFISYVYC